MSAGLESLLRPPTARPERRCDLVFEGGGVKGIGLVGALAVLEEQGFEPQNLAGSSAGSIVATLAAAGYSAAALREIVLGLDFRAFEDRAWEECRWSGPRSRSSRIRASSRARHSSRGSANAWPSVASARSATWCTRSTRMRSATAIASTGPHRSGSWVGGTIGYIRSLVQTMLEAHDRLYLEQADFARTIPVETLGVSTTEFDLPRERAEALYESGRRAAEEFLDRRRDFEAYKAEFRRGKRHSRRRELAASLGLAPRA